jgi:hypothetical protein
MLSTTITPAAVPTLADRSGFALNEDDTVHCYHCHHDTPVAQAFVTEGARPGATVTLRCDSCGRRGAITLDLR